MAKKSKKKTEGAKADSNAPREADVKDLEAKPNQQDDVAPNKDGKYQPIIRAIRVTAEVLDAAKAYKKATGVSFYTLGFESISDRLVKKGFLKKENQ